MSEKLEIRNKQKEKAFIEWMKGDHVLLHFDSRVEGVQVPDHLQDDPAVTLKLSYLFHGTTEHDDRAITAYLKFSGNYEECIIPWSAIWSMTSEDKQNSIWPEDLPKEMIMQLATSRIREMGKKLFGGEKDSSKEEEQPATQPAPAAQPKEEPAEASSETKSESSENKVSHLKRIK